MSGAQACRVAPAVWLRREVLSSAVEAEHLIDENRAVSYVALVERVVELLLSVRDAEEVLVELHHLFQTNPTRVRAGRRTERPELRYAHKVRFHKYVKKLIA